MINNLSLDYYLLLNDSIITIVGYLSLYDNESKNICKSKHKRARC